MSVKLIVQLHLSFERKMITRKSSGPETDHCKTPAENSVPTKRFQRPQLGDLLVKFSVRSRKMVIHIPLRIKKELTFVIKYTKSR